MAVFAKDHDRFPNHRRHGVWVPAFAGTTIFVWRHPPAVAGGKLAVRYYRHSKSRERPCRLRRLPFVRRSRRSFSVRPFFRAEGIPLARNP